MSIGALSRKLTGEIMDSPTLDQREHLLALNGLRRINRASHAGDAILQILLDFSRRNQMTSLRMLDIACGGGDVPVEVAKQAGNAGIKIHLTLLDRSDLATARSAEAARTENISCETICTNIFAAGLAEKTFDVVTNSLFLHHLAEEEVITALTQMRKAARGIVIISDLRRSILGWIIAWVGCRVLSRSKVVHYDGPVSVRAAWTIEELNEMARRAGMVGVKVSRAWPWRMVLVWEAGDDANG